MKNLIIEPHYLGSLEYFAALKKHEEILFEVNDSFPKQTFRNRAYFLTSNKIQPLIVPVKYANGDKTKEVLIDNSQRWVKDHWGAFYSGYGKAPFFEYFGEEFKTIWEQKWEKLIDLNIEFMKICFRILQLDLRFSFNSTFERQIENGLRDKINPKKPFSDRKIYIPAPYMQLFGDTFTPNLSIVDLLMNEGPNAAHILTQSTLEGDQT